MSSDVAPPEAGTGGGVPPAVPPAAEGSGKVVAAGSAVSRPNVRSGEGRSWNS